MRRLSTLILTIGLTGTFLTLAHAVDFKSEIKGLDGKPIPISETDKTPVTLGSVAEVALIAPGGVEPLTPEEKTRRFFLALKIHEGKDGNFTVEELTLVKKVIGSVYGPLIYGRAVELIDRPVPGGGGGSGGAGGKAK